MHDKVKMFLAGEKKFMSRKLIEATKIDICLKFNTDLDRIGPATYLETHVAEGE